MEIDKVKVGERIQKIRKNVGLSQAEVAHKLGIQRPSVSQIESGERNLSADELIKLAELFKVLPEEIFRDDLEVLPRIERNNNDSVEITIFRHGEAMDDLYNQYGGWADPELSPSGINKAFLVAQNLKRKKENFEIIFTSPLKRARQKAEIISREINVDVRVLQYLKERNTYGLLCGINKDVAKKKFPDLVADYESGKYVLGSERDEDFNARIPMIFEYIHKSGFSRVCCVTHGKMMTAIIKNILKMNPDNLDEGCMLRMEMTGKKYYYVQSEGIKFGR